MFEPGGSATRDLLGEMQNGLYVTEVMGQGVSLVTGDYSRGAAGFRVENGEISHPVKNFRWNESPIFMLNNIEMMGEPVRISAGESSGLTNSVIVPPLKVRDFTFTSISDAI